MNNIDIKFNKLMSIILKCMLLIIIIASIIMCFANLIAFNLSATLIFSSVIIIALFLGYRVVNLNISQNKKIIILILIASIVRLLWIMNADNVPNSDFAVMYEAGSQIASHGNTTIFKGTSYGARFPHLTLPILYMAAVRYIIAQNTLLAMKLLNLICGITVLILLYFIAKELFTNKKYALYAMTLGAVFPSLVTYTSVYCSENIAMPFYLWSILLFLKNIKKSKPKSLFYILSSIILGIGNLLRMIAAVILIAYVMYILIFLKERILQKIKDILCIILPYILILLCISSILQKSNVTQYSLWGGCEPKITSVLKGTNMNTFGMWNKEDAEIAENNLGDYDEIEKESKEIIYKRLTTASPHKIIIFYVEKLAAQWCIGDFAGSFWTQKNMTDDKIIFKVGNFGNLSFQIIYLFMLIMILSTLNKKCINQRDNNKKDINERDRNPSNELSLFYLIFLGYIATYLLTENQCRYGYIVSWVFIILSMNGFMISMNGLKNHLKFFRLKKLKY